MKFIVDCMLGKLAKWLRILGFDVLFFPKAEDDTLLVLARKEERMLLSRDHALLARAKGLKSLLIESETWEDQVKQVLNSLGLRAKVRPYSRCVECNRKLKRIPKSRAANLVSPFVYERGDSFAICPSCGRVFWQGTHFSDMETKLAELLKKTL
jgi:uncharacterized protein with PIN domain